MPVGHGNDIKVTMEAGADVSLNTINPVTPSTPPTCPACNSEKPTLRDSETCLDSARIRTMHQASVQQASYSSLSDSLHEIRSAKHLADMRPRPHPDAPQNFSGLKQLTDAEKNGRLAAPQRPQKDPDWLIEAPMDPSLNPATDSFRSCWNSKEVRIVIYTVIQLCRSCETLLR